MFENMFHSLGEDKKRVTDEAWEDGQTAADLLPGSGAVATHLLLSHTQPSWEVKLACKSQV